MCSEHIVIGMQYCCPLPIACQRRLFGHMAQAHPLLMSLSAAASSSGTGGAVFITGMATEATDFTAETVATAARVIAACWAASGCCSEALPSPLLLLPLPLPLLLLLSLPSVMLFILPSAVGFPSCPCSLPPPLPTEAAADSAGCLPPSCCCPKSAVFAVLSLLPSLPPLPLLPVLSPLLPSAACTVAVGLTIGGAPAAAAAAAASPALAAAGAGASSWRQVAKAPPRMPCTNTMSTSGVPTARALMAQMCRHLKQCTCVMGSSPTCHASANTNCFMLSARHWAIQCRTQGRHF